MSRTSKNEGENWISRKSHFLDWCDFIMRMDDKLQEEISFWETKMILINPSDEEHRKRLLQLLYLSSINGLQTLAKMSILWWRNKTIIFWYSNCKMHILSSQSPHDLNFKKFLSCFHENECFYYYINFIKIWVSSVWLWLICFAPND